MARRLRMLRPRRRRCAWCPREVGVQGYSRHVRTHYCESHRRFHTQLGLRVIHGGVDQARLVAAR